VERASFVLDEEGWVYARVSARPGSNPPRVSLWARGGDAWQRTPGALADPGSAPTSFTVGAVRATSYLSSGAEFFSSFGPTHGGLPKPEVAGPDGLSGAIYGTLGFYGTSASTPAVAAAAALLLSEDPTLTPLQAGERLRGSIVTPTRWEGPDLEGSPALGAGRVRLAPPGAPLAGFCGGGTPAVAVLAPFLLLCRRRSARLPPISPRSPT
jgi:subtilisin family serine protease